MFSHSVSREYPDTVTLYLRLSSCWPDTIRLRRVVSKVVYKRDVVWGRISMRSQAPSCMSTIGCVKSCNNIYFNFSWLRYGFSGSPCSVLVVLEVTSTEIIRSLTLLRIFYTLYLTCSISFVRLWSCASVGLSLVTWNVKYLIAKNFELVNKHHAPWVTRNTDVAGVGHTPREFGYIVDWWSVWVFLFVVVLRYYLVSRSTYIVIFSNQKVSCLNIYAIRDVYSRSNMSFWAHPFFYISLEWSFYEIGHWTFAFKIAQTDFRHFPRNPKLRFIKCLSLGTFSLFTFHLRICLFRLVASLSILSILILAALLHVDLFFRSYGKSS